MSPAERGENFQDETTVFPSFDEVTGTGYQLHPPPYTKEEQIALLAGRTHGATIWEALHLYCNGCRDRVGELFTISQDEYLQWAREESLEHFINMGSPQTDFHFLTKSDRGWELRFQELSLIHI